MLVSVALLCDLDDDDDAAGWLLVVHGNGMQQNRNLEETSD